MIIKTSVFGEVEIDRQNIIDFPNGIPGFPDEKEFIFLEFPDTPFTVMQSLRGQLYFWVLNPFDFFEEYEIELSDDFLETLAIEKPDDVLVYNIVTIQDSIYKATCNTQAPIIINYGQKKARQLVLNHPDYQIRQRLFIDKLSNEPQQNRRQASVSINP